MTDLFLIINIISGVMALASVAVSVYVLVNVIRQRKQNSKLSVLTATGASGNKQLEENWLKVVSQMFAVFQKKSHDYGTDNPINGGIRGVILRMGDKSARLWQNFVIRDTMLVSTESAEDTLLDLANYALIGVLLLRGEWPTPTNSFPFSRDALLDVFEDLLKKEADTL